MGTIVLISVIADSIYYKASTDNLKFSIELIQMAIKILQQYGWRYSVAILFVITLQTGLLLWWGVIFVEVISHVNSRWSFFSLIFLSFSLFWVTQFFHAVIATLNNGLVLWYFVKFDDRSLCAGERVVLYLRIACTSNIGSLCKGALYSPSTLFLSPTVLLNIHNRRFPVNNGLKYLMDMLSRIGRQNHRLGLCFIALYGVTYNRAAEILISSNNQSLNIVLEDSTSFILKTVGTGFATIFSVLFVIIAEKEEGFAWPVFFIACFCLLYSGISLALHAIRSAVGKFH